MNFKIWILVFIGNIHFGFTQNEYYTYDQNGNLTADQNKDIEFIVYNVLNLPEEILFSDGGMHNVKYMASWAENKRLFSG